MKDPSASSRAVRFRWDASFGGCSVGVVMMWCHLTEPNHTHHAHICPFQLNSFDLFRGILFV